jgi:hypothetical protein
MSFRQWQSPGSCVMPEPLERTSARSHFPLI